VLEKRQRPDGEHLRLDIDVIRAAVLNNPYLTEGDKERFKPRYERTPRSSVGHRPPDRRK
jgi:hypothetical protein